MLMQRTLYLYIYIYIYTYIHTYIYKFAYLPIDVAVSISTEYIQNALYECIWLRKPIIDGLFSSDNCV